MEPLNILAKFKFLALGVPEIIGGILKNWEVPGYANAPFSHKFLKAFWLDKCCEYTCHI